MKIGAFAKKYNLNRTTIRFYTDKNLLLPNQEGTYPEYDKQCEKDIEDILRFKEMGFTIDEIIKLKAKERFHAGLYGKHSIYLEEFLRTKIESHSSEIQLLQKKIKMIESYRKQEMARSYELMSGVPLSALNFLCCPKCNSVFSISEAYIVNNNLNRGILSCSCGSNFFVEDGIIHQRDGNLAIKECFRGKREDDIKYLKNEHFALFKRLGNAYDAIYDMWSHERGILFINADTDILMMESKGLFRKRGVYIFASFDMYCLKNMKEHLSQNQYEGDFLFIHYIDSLPIVKSIPYMVDIGGNIFDQFFNYPGYVIQKMDRHLPEIEEGLLISFEDIMEINDYLKCYDALELFIKQRKSIGIFNGISNVLPNFNTIDDTEIVLYHFSKNE